VRSLGDAINRHFSVRNGTDSSTCVEMYGSRLAYNNSRGSVEPRFSRKRRGIGNTFKGSLLTDCRSTISTTVDTFDLEA